MKRFAFWTHAVFASLMALFAASLLLCFGSRSLAGEGKAASPPAETSIRNVTEAPVSYTVQFVGADSEPIEKTVAPKIIDRFPQERDIIVKFTSGTERRSYRLDRGKPYSFRHDTDGRLDLYQGAHGSEAAVDLAPFVPTPMVVVDKMLALLALDAQSVVYDIGCGDGRIIITAAKKHGARGVGIDIVAERIRESREGAKAAGVEAQVEFRLEDAFKVDVSPATAVALYLLPESNALLRPKLEKELRSGVLVVSHNYEIGGWEERMVRSETVKDDSGKDHHLFLYRK